MNILKKFNFARFASFWQKNNFMRLFFEKNATKDSFYSHFLNKNQCVIRNKQDNTFFCKISFFFAQQRPLMPRFNRQCERNSYESFINFRNSYYPNRISYFSFCGLNKSRPIHANESTRSFSGCPA